MLTNGEDKSAKEPTASSKVASAGTSTKVEDQIKKLMMKTIINQQKIAYLKCSLNLQADNASDKMS